MSLIHQAEEWFKHWLLSVGRHSLHEPFIFDLYSEVIYPSLLSKGIPEIENIRRQYQLQKEKIPLSHIGAASRQSRRSPAQLAYEGSLKGSYALLMHNLIDSMGFTNIIELGTSLGLTSLYLSHRPEASLYTFEGDPELIFRANSLFESVQRNNITLIPGNIDETLPHALQSIEKIDLIFFDANHRYLPTMNYFEWAMEKAHDKSVFVFDDIHWSKEMTKAWKEISADRRVTLSIDLYRMGIVFFRPLMGKYHYYLMN